MVQKWQDLAQCLEKPEYEGVLSLRDLKEIWQNAGDQINSIEKERVANVLASEEQRETMLIS